jgi:hypothetical protein
LVREPNFRADQEMFLAMHDQPSPVDPFLFLLAKDLGKTIGELEQMPHREYTDWAAFYKVKHAIESTRR